MSSVPSPSPKGYLRGACGLPFLSGTWYRAVLPQCFCSAGPLAATRSSPPVPAQPTWHCQGTTALRPSSTPTASGVSRALLLHLHLGKKRDLISNSSFKNKGSLYLPPLFSHTFPHSLSFILYSSQPFLGSDVLYLLLPPPPPLSVIAFCTYLFIYLGLFSSAQLILYLLLYDTHNLWAAFYSSFNTFHFPSVFLRYIALPCLISASISHVLTNL